MIKLNIPNTECQKIKSFLDLDLTMQTKFIDAMNEARKDLSSHSNCVVIANKLTLELEMVVNVVDVAIRLCQAREQVEYNINDFVNEIVVEYSKIAAVDDTAKMNIAKLLTIENSQLVLSRKVIESMGKQAKTLVAAEIITNPHHIIGNNNIVASGIVHQLRLMYKENGVENTTYIAMDDNDLDLLKRAINKAKETASDIKQSFPSANFITL